MTNLYATLAEFKAANNSFASDTAFDSAINLALDAAAETVEGICNRGVPLVADSNPSVRTYPGLGDWFQSIDECVSVTLVEVKGSPTDPNYTAWSANDWVPYAGDPSYPNFNRTPFTGVMVSGVGTFRLFTSGRFSGQPGFPEFRREIGLGRSVPTVRITARFGYSATVPMAIKEAVIAQAFRWVKRGQNAWSDTVGSAEMGILLFRKAMDPDLQQLLINGGFVRPAIGKR